MKKVVKLTESDLMRIVKRVIKENKNFRSDKDVNSLFEDIMSKIENIYEDISNARSMEELEMSQKKLNKLYEKINKSKKISHEQKDELTDSLSSCYGLIDDMFSELGDDM
jgi:predicted metalloendopeptidase